MSAATLTEREASILRCIVELTEARGYPPTVREIGAAVGLTSTASVHAHLRSLHERGYITREPSPRTLRVVAP